jgi:rRNA processing protein Krr1/Pno1
MWPLVYSSTLRFVAVKPLYKYLIGREGQTMDPKRLSKQISDYIILFKSSVRNLKQYNLSDIARKVAERLIVNNHHNVYLWSRNSISDAAEQMLIAYDKSLKLESPQLYNALNEKNYHIASNYKYIKEWRDRDYPKDLSIPFLERVKISLYVRMHK